MHGFAWVMAILFQPVLYGTYLFTSLFLFNIYRFHAYAANFRQITEAADNVLERIQTRLQLVGNGPSRKEEQNFYKGQRKVATKLIDEIHDQLEKINDLEEEFKRKYPDRPILAKSKSKRLKKKYTARCEKEKKRESEELKKRKTYQDYWEKQEWGSNEEKHEKVNDSDDNMAKERPDEVNDSDDSMAGERPEVNDSDDIMAGERPEVNDSDDIMADGERPEVNDLDDIMAGERNDEGSDFYDNMADAINSVMDTDNESETSVSEEKHTDMIDLSNDLDISDSDTDSETSSSDSSSDSED